MKTIVHWRPKAKKTTKKMASADEEDNDTVLSDVEADDTSPIAINTPSPDDLSVERFMEILSELDRERKAREAAEKSKSELQVSFNRLKTLAHEAIKKRDECTRQKDEALKSNHKLFADLAEISKERDEADKAKDSLRSEIETSTQILVTGIEKISGKLSNIKDFSVDGLPRSQNYSGLPLIAYGVIKRSSEIVEELSKSRNEAREQIDQRNYEIAIEVSKLESTISELRDEVSKKSNVIENLIAEKDGKVNSAENKLRDLELKIDSQRPLLVDHLNLISKIHDRIYDIMKIVDGKEMDKSEEQLESMFVTREMDMEENIRVSLEGLESIYELTGIVVGKTKDFVEERSREVTRVSETASQLVKEKEHIGCLLRSALSRRITTDLSSKTNELIKVAENGLREAGIDFRFSNHLGDGKGGAAAANDGSETEEDEISALAGALESIIKESQLEIIELQHYVEELRVETRLLKEHVEAQAKELNHRKQQMEELEEKERAANEIVEGLMMDIAAAEEEITRWKVAAQQEAAAGKAVEQEFVEQLSTLHQELEEGKQALVEFEKKLKFKEEIAAAAMAARDAAGNSLRLADLRASRLRDRVEELARQLEQRDTRENSTGLSGPRYVCWPWQWLGLDLVGSQQPQLSDTQPQSSNEMELSEPFL